MGELAIDMLLEESSGLRNKLVGRTYRHLATGNLYKVLDVVVNEATKSMLIIYVGENRVRWARPVDSFMETDRINRPIRFVEVKP